MGSNQGHIAQHYIFSCLIVRAECTRLCCRMLLLGSWQRLILKCQLLSRGTGSNELPQCVLVPGTGVSSPCFPSHRVMRHPEKELFPSSEMKVKYFTGAHVCTST